MNSNSPWTEEEVKQLTRLCKANKTMRRIKRDFPDKTEPQIRARIKKLNLSYNKKRKPWTPEELKQFKEDWTDHKISGTTLRTKYKNRSISALRACAKRLNLTRRPFDSSFLRISDIAAEMQVSKDRVRTWIKHGLITYKSHITPIKYLIRQEDLLDFLKEHPKFYDASKISPYIFINEPEWLKAKRREDAENFKTKSKKAQAYSDAECLEIIRLFKRGCSNKEIGEKLNRTEYGIERMLTIFGLSRKKYNDYEIDIIKEYHDKITIDELVAMLPLRTRSGVIAKCEQLGLKYKTVRKPRRTKIQIIEDQKIKDFPA